MNLEEVSESVMYSSLAVLKSNLRMNKLGMKHSAQKGKAIRPMVAEFLGLKKNAHMMTSSMKFRNVWMPYLQSVSQSKIRKLRWQGESARLEIS